MKIGFSIQFKILALLISLIIIPTAILTLTSYNTSSGSLEDEFKKALDGTTSNIEKTLDLLLKNYSDGIEKLAENQSMKDVLRGNTDEIFHVLHDYSENHVDLQNVYIGTDKKDFYVLPEQEVPAGFDPTSRPWYQAAVSEKGLVWTDPYVDSLSGKLVVTVAKPVYSGDTLVGVAGADILLDELVKIIVSYKIGEKGYFILADTAGNIIAHPQADKIGKPLSTDILRKTAASSEKEGTLDYVYNSQHKFTDFATIERTGWKLFGTFDYSEITGKTSVILRGSLVNTLLVILVAGILAVIISRPIIKGIKLLAGDMLRIGEGDFTVRSSIKTKDEIGLLSSTLNKMAQELGSIISNIKSMAMEVSGSSNSLAASSEESTATTEEISRTIQEIVRVTEDQAFNTEDGLKKTMQLAENIQEVSREIAGITGTVSVSGSLNERGVQSVILLKEASDATNAASLNVGEAISVVDKSSEQIGTIVETMSSIANQTNLLALNASIEAARAGESGKGFSVVANEIRKLAEQSKEASEDIRRLINDIQVHSKNAVSTMEETKPVVLAQNNAVSETKAVFEEISRTIEKLNAEIVLISTLNDGMTRKKDEILANMESISASAEQTSASTEQIAASTHEQLAAADEVAKTAEQLNDLAQNLAKKVSRFRL